MTSETPLLTPIPYHAELKDDLKRQEAAMWDWLASAEAKAGYAEELRLDLLKSTYRLSVESHAQVYALAEQAKKALGLDIPITIYQSQERVGLNAAIHYLPGEGHIVLFGQVLQLFKDDELLSVLAHELTHYQLRQRDGGDYHIMDRLVDLLTQSPLSAPSHLHTARHVQLYSEIYCDRGSWLATRDLSSVVRGMVKIRTGMADVHAESYLKQAEEVLGQKAVVSGETTHPETYIRAQALSLWINDAETAEPRIAGMIEKNTDIDELDLPGQARFAEITRSLINELLQPEWFRTAPVFAHARLFFEDFAVHPVREVELPPEGFHPRTQEYFGYVLLDFAVMDPELEDEPLKQAIRVAAKWGFAEAFATQAQKELKLKKKEWEKLAVGK